MASHSAQQSDHGAFSTPLLRLERLSGGRALAELIFQKMGRDRFFEDLQDEDVRLLATFMHTYRAQVGEVIIREGDIDDFMVLVIEGKIQVVKHDKQGQAQPLGIATPGMSLGEMSMIDGEPRFASCVATEPSTVAVLTRDAMVRMLMEYPNLGSKLLIKLVTLLSKRLRETSSALMSYRER